MKGVAILGATGSIVCKLEMSAEFPLSWNAIVARMRGCMPAANIDATCPNASEWFSPATVRFPVFGSLS